MNTDENRVDDPSLMLDSLDQRAVNHMRQRIQEVQESNQGQQPELVGLDENSSGILQIISQTFSIKRVSDDRSPRAHVSESEGHDEDLIIENSENSHLASC